MMHLLTLLALAVIASATTTLAAPPDDILGRDPVTARVRAGDKRTAALLVRGLERSATVRNLVTELERRDVIVYLEMQPALKQRLAGRLAWVTATPRHRYVRISINPELSTDTAIATLGHELQHALEVATAPEIRCSQTLENFYRQHGESNPSEVNGWDTEAARVAGEDVRRELASLQTGRVTDSIQSLDPGDWFVVYRRARGMLPP